VRFVAAVPVRWLLTASCWAACACCIATRAASNGMTWTCSGAALAYYTLFSLAPLLLIVTAVAGLVFGAEAARGEIFGQLQGLVGAPGAAAVQSLLESVNRPAGGWAATALGLVLMLLGATTVFAELQNTLDRIWRAPARPAGGLWLLLRARVLSFGLILGLGFLLMVSLVASAALAGLQRWWAPQFQGWALVLAVLDPASSFALVTLVFALIYKLMPRVRIPWSDVWVGALVTAGLFAVGRHLLGAVPRAGGRQRRLRGRGLAGGGAGVGVLLGADLPAGCRVHLGDGAAAQPSQHRALDGPEAPGTFVVVPALAAAPLLALVQQQVDAVVVTLAQAGG
jgi:membrane protein